MPTQSWKIANLRALRAVLLSYASLKEAAGRGDVSSAVILLDLDQALGTDAGRGASVLTDRQAQAVRLHLLQSIPAAVVAVEMEIEPRVVYLLVTAGLKRLLAFLSDGTQPCQWQPWQLTYLKNNAHLPRKELAYDVGRTVPAVCKKLWELRKKGIVISIRASGRPAISERQSA